ncbi:MAG: hypothetical protein V1833_03755 [Elusimicrobiota bacterium]
MDMKNHQMKKSVRSSEFRVWRKSITKWIRFLLVLTMNYELLTMNCFYAADFKIEQVRPKIITPASSPGMNDVLIVSYENPNDSNVSGKIITLNGSYLADMLVDNSDTYNPKITWDGKDDGSSVVSSGIYIYQIEVEGKVFNGTVVVAR